MSTMTNAIAPYTNVRSADVVALVPRTPGGSTLVPVVTVLCWDCGKPVAFVPGEFFLSRVNGDSSYGYEPAHAECCARHRERR